MTLSKSRTLVLLSTNIYMSGVVGVARMCVEWENDACTCTNAYFDKDLHQNVMNTSVLGPQIICLDPSPIYKDIGYPI